MCYYFIIINNLLFYNLELCLFSISKKGLRNIKLLLILFSYFIEQHFKFIVVYNWATPQMNFIV